MSKNNSSKIAVIYCRVSSAKQSLHGNGLSSQETRCREYASYRGYEVVNVFQDDMTGKIAKRPAMVKMLAFLRQQNRNNHASNCVVIIDDISRLARGLEAHLELRTLIGKVGGKLESPSLEFGEDSDSLLIENMLASVAQHHREKNGEQTKNRMRARMMNGYWVFPAPLGYRFEKRQGEGNVLVRVEPIASIVKEALEGFASGRLETRAEFKRFLESQPVFPKSIRGDVTFRTVDFLISREIYAGLISRKEWGLNCIEGKHEPLISYDTYQKIQKRSGATANAPARKDINEDFPLRGFVTCGSCNNPMSGYWAKGRNKRYAYYEYFNKHCTDYRKRVKRDKLEGDFEVLLKSLVPSEDLFKLAYDIFKDTWDENIASLKQRRSHMKRQISAIDKQTEQFLERVVATNNMALVTTYEQKIDDLHSQKRILLEKTAQFDEKHKDFKRVFRTAFEFLANPWKLWLSDKLEDKRAVLKLTFMERIAYDRNEGFRTPQLSEPFMFLRNFDQKKKLAESEVICSNSVFETLADWNEQLKHIDTDLGGPSL